MGSGKGSGGQVHILAFHIFKEAKHVSRMCVTNFSITTALQSQCTTAGQFTTKTYTVAWSQSPVVCDGLADTTAAISKLTADRRNVCVYVSE